ncbi:phosphoribosyl-AMP cyclohydrolase [Leptospira sp. WS60.C2]
MIQIPSGKDIVLLSKPSLLAHEVNLKVIDSKQAEEFVADFDFNQKKLFVDCDEDAFLEISPSMTLADKHLLWENGKIAIEPKDLNSILERMPKLSPFLAQDEFGKDLMLAWGKKESLLHALETGYGTYFSRSRNGKWVKGEESGHLQQLKRVYVHLNPFFIQYVTEQKGAACHTGYYSCFFRELGKNQSVSFVYPNKVGE